jgi:predicted N-acetyltransferase YhbS
MTMSFIRRYEEADAERVGRLIADTYGTFNLPQVSPEQHRAMLGPFANAASAEASHRAAIADAIRAPLVLVAEVDGQICGVLRGGRVDKKGRTVLQSLFVAGDRHRQGIGRELVAQFEREYVALGTHVFKLASSLFAVPFYLSMGYTKSTGERSLHSFGVSGSAYQPMKKVVKPVLKM